MVVTIQFPDFMPGILTFVYTFSELVVHNQFTLEFQTKDLDPYPLINGGQNKVR